VLGALLRVVVGAEWGEGWPLKWLFVGGALTMVVYTAVDLRYGERRYG
jgi:hypothetical protein